MKQRRQAVSVNRTIERLVARAARGAAPVLAVPLGRHAEREGLRWDELARHLGGSADGLNQVALCGIPRPATFAEDVAAIAVDHVSAERLLALLRRIQIREALGTFPPVHAELLPWQESGWARDSMAPVFAESSDSRLEMTFALMSEYPIFSTSDNPPETYCAVDDPLVTAVIGEYEHLSLLAENVERRIHELAPALHRCVEIMGQLSNQHGFGLREPERYFTVAARIVREGEPLAHRIERLREEREHLQRQLERVSDRLRQMGGGADEPASTA